MGMRISCNNCIRIFRHYFGMLAVLQATEFTVEKEMNEREREREMLEEGK